MLQFIEKDFFSLFLGIHLNITYYASLYLTMAKILLLTPHPPYVTSSPLKFTQKNIYESCAPPRIFYAWLFETLLLFSRFAWTVNISHILFNEG